MQLPSNGIKWTNFRNTTPTFNLTSIEKPDFSPFLIHMTGKNSLVSILKGENAPKEVKIKEKYGYLKAIKPAFDGQETYYDSAVVCFTESPVFALDFFRYRSFRRWDDDQQYGIGFSKTDLIREREVRPVIYLDTLTNSELLSFANKLINGNLQVVNNQGEIVNFNNLFEKLKPLLFPLLENTPLQGFMWEREWRCPNNKGMSFPHSAIKVICCPRNERQQIEDVLEDLAINIDIIESWREYDDVTNFLKQRESEINRIALSKIKEIKSIAELESLKSQNEQTFNALHAYYGVFKETVDGMEARNIRQIVSDMKQKTIEIDEQIKAIQEEIKAKEEQAKINKG